MSGLLAAKNPVQKTAPVASSLRITTSCYGRPIPLGWGKFKVAGWLMKSEDFRAIAHTEQVSGGKGGGGAPSTTSYTYESALIVGICEGPINNVPTLWKGKDYLQAATTSSQTYQKTESHYVPSSLQVTVDAPASVLSTAQVLLPGLTWEDPDRYLVSGTDYTRSGSVYTFLTVPEGRTVNFTYNYTQTSAPVNPLGQANLTLFKGSYSQTAWSYDTSNHPTEALAYRGVAYVASDTFDLGTDTSVPNLNFEVDSNFGYSLTVRDVNPKDFLIDFLTNTDYGAFFVSQGLGDWSDYSTYCIASGIFLSPEYTEQESAASILARVLALTNSDMVFADKVVEIVPYADSAVTGNGKTWTPNLTAAYNLTDDDFLPNGDTGPVKGFRKNPNERVNQLRIKFRNRAQQYNDDVTEVKDEAEIGRNGLRPATSETETPEVKDKAVSITVGNLLVQRAVNVCNTYSFRLKFNYALIKPMALLSLTYAPLNLSGQLVRVTKISETGSDGDLEIEAEEVPVGVASSIAYPKQVPYGLGIDFNASPGAVEPPVIFEAPAYASNTGLELCIAATGLGANWGGFRAWFSLDGTTYREIARIEGGSRYGKLTGAESGGVLPVVLNKGQLTTVTAAERDALVSLCYVGGSAPEFLAYRTATLTSALHYDLGGTLVRGAYTSNVYAHATDDPFVRLDERVARSGPLDLSYIGKTIHVKLTSFNIYGGGEESLASATDYTYTIIGNLFGIPPTYWEDVEGYVGDPGSFFDGFESPTALDRWTNYSGTGELSLVAVTDAGSGGQILRVGNNSGNDQAWLIHDARIPFDPTALYRVKARVRRTAGTGTTYVGLAGVGADGAAFVNTAGSNSSSSQHYVAAAGAAPASSWTEYTGYVRGTAATGSSTAKPDPNAPGVMHTDVKYIRPLVLVNYNVAAGTTDVDFVSVERLGGQIGTGDLGDETATEVVADVVPGWSVADTATPFTRTVTVASVTIANTSGAARSVQFEAGVTKVALSWDTSMPTLLNEVRMEWSSTSSGSGTTVLSSAWHDSSLSALTVSAATMDMLSLDDGDSLTVDLVVEINHTDNVSLSGESAYVRASLIKK